MSKPLPASPLAGGHQMEATVEASTFEGMFQRALQPQGAFAEGLKAAGFDLKDIKPRYPVHIWRDCLEVARRHCYPNINPEQGYREVGKRFIEGFFETIIGRFLVVAFPLVGPNGVMKLLPRHWKAARKDIEVIPVQEGDRRWRVTFRDHCPLPDFIAGIVEAGGKRSGVEMNVTVDVRSETGFELLVTW